MGQKQTILNEKEEKVYSAVKEFLVQQNVLPTSTDYAMMKYCVANVCKQTIDIIRKNSLGLEALGLTEDDFVGIFKLRARERT